MSKLRAQSSVCLIRMTLNGVMTSVRLGKVSVTSGNVLWRQVTSSSALLASFLTVSNSNSNVTSSNVLLTSMTSSNALLASFWQLIAM